MAPTIDFHDHIRQFNETMRGIARVLYVGAGYNLSAHPVLASKPWRRIYTTSTDEEMPHIFSRSDRQVHAIYDIAELPTIGPVLDHSNPLLVYLSPIGGEPTDIGEKLEQEQNCQARRMTLREIMRTALAHLIIVGYDPSAQSEIPTKELCTLLMNLGERCVTFYGLSAGIKQDPYINMLVNRGIATMIEQDLGDALEEASKKTDAIMEESTPIDIYEPDDLRSAVFISGQPLQVQQSLYYEFSRYGQLLSIRQMDTIAISRMLQVDYFYRFLKQSPYEPQWYGYNPRNGFAVQREYEEKLYTIVSAKLANGASDPVILAGQTSSGKSVALAALAYRVFHERKYPVLFVTNPETTFAIDSPSFQALDNLLYELEQRGAERVLLIIDYSVYNLQRNESIRRVMDRCANRGRKVVIVASAVQTASHYKVIEAPIRLTEAEKQAFVDLLVEKGRLDRNQVESWLQRSSQADNLLSMLYRLLWDIHPELEHGMYTEISRGLEDTRQKLLDLPLPKLMPTSNSSIAEQLVRLGLAEDPNRDSPEIAADRQSRIVQSLDSFSRCLAVASLFRLRMPITMALRLLTIPEWYHNRKLYLNVVFESPWLICVMDSDSYAPGEYYITFRTLADAQIYLASLHIDKAAEMGIVAETIDSLREITGAFYNDEIRFLEQLIRMIGPNSDDNSVRGEGSGRSQWYYTYGPGSPQVIQALARLRDNGIIAPQLVAQEITYIREYYGADNQSAATRVTYLNLAIRIAREMLDLASQPASSDVNWKPGLVDSILVESIFAELRLERAYRDLAELGDVSLCDSNTPVSALTSYAERLAKLVGVIRSQPENSYAYTALLSCFNSYYRDPSVERMDKLMQLAAVVEIVDTVSASIPAVDANESYQKRQYEFVTILSEVSGNAEDERYFERLLKAGSAIGVYMKARTMLAQADIKFGRSLNEHNVNVCRQVLALLETPEYESVTRFHAASQNLRLQLKWLCCNAGKPIFEHERQCTCISADDWSAIYRICVDFKTLIIDRQPDSSYVATVYYILALAAAQMGDYDTATNTWRLVHENDFHSVARQRTWHILCKPDGEPIPFTGTFNTPHPLQERRVYIRELQRPVLYPSLQSLNKSQPTGEVYDLCVGTSYRGFSAFTMIWAKRRLT